MGWGESRKKFKEWLENKKNKPHPAAKIYHYANRKFACFYSANCYPELAFSNPVPWKPIHKLLPKEANDLSGENTKSLVISQSHGSSSW